MGCAWQAFQGEVQKIGGGKTSEGKRACYFGRGGKKIKSQNEESGQTVLQEHKKLPSVAGEKQLPEGLTGKTGGGRSAERDWNV